MDSSGTLQWSTTIGGPGSLTQIGRSYTLEDGTTIGFVADPYWTPISAAIGLSAALQNSHMGDVNSKPNGNKI